MHPHLRNVSRTRAATAQYQDITLIMGLINDLVTMLSNIFDFKETYVGDGVAPSE